MSLAGKVVIITGASSGIGRAIGLCLAEEKATVCLLGRRLDALQAVAAAARGAARRLEVFPIDLTVDREVLNLARNLGERFGRIDVLVHSAGVFGMGGLESAPAGALDEQYRVNLRAPLVLTQALLPLLKQARGQIVFINSTAGLQARAQVGYYAATKHALKALSESLRQEVNAAGVRVTTLFLGRTATPMQEAIFRAEGKSYAGEKLLQPEDVAGLLRTVLQLPETAEVTEVHMRPAIKSY